MALISEEEKLRRRLSNESVLGTFAMEGLSPDEATQALLLKYAEGALSLDEFSTAMDIHAHRLMADQNTMAGAA